MNERLKLLRKTLKISQDEFGKRLGITGGGISKLEKGDRNITEQMVKSICREFAVDYVWLTTGEGEMFIDSDDDIIETIDRIMIGENEFHKNLFKTFARLDENELLALESIMTKAIELMGGKSNE